jgi:hypothetical protein
MEILLDLEFMRLEKEGKLAVNQAFDMDYGTFLQVYFDLQKRAQYSPDAEEAKRAYRAKRTPKWE